MAVQSGYREVAELLLGSSASLDNITRLLIDRGANVNAQEEDRWTALHLASSKEHLTTLAFTPSPTLALTLCVVALTAPALTPCVVALAACPHTTTPRQQLWHRSLEGVAAFDISCIGHGTPSLFSSFSITPRRRHHPPMSSPHFVTPHWPYTTCVPPPLPPHIRKRSICLKMA
jgi:Ankyrin repeats (many copies)